MDKKVMEQNVRGNSHGVCVVWFDTKEGKLIHERVGQENEAKVRELYEKIAKIEKGGNHEPFLVINSRGQQIFPERGQGVMAAQKGVDEEGKETDVVYCYAKDEKGEYQDVYVLIPHVKDRFVCYFGGENLKAAAEDFAKAKALDGSVMGFPTGYNNSLQYGPEIYPVPKKVLPQTEAPEKQ